MSSEYIRARSKAPPEDTLHCITIDGKPYFPNFVVDPQDEDSIKTAASLCVHSMNSNGGSKLSIKKVTGGNTNLLYRVTKIDGGITNQLYRVTVDECLAVLVRIFGAPGLIDRDVENSVYAALSEKGIAPPYHGRFANGRVEGWLEMRPLDVPELGVFSKQIAEQLARLHVDFVPATKEEPTMWSQLRSWMEQALVAKFKNASDEQRAGDLGLKSLPAELDWLQDSVVPKDSKTAFCHNDALAANFLVSADSKHIQLIDFEYGGMNFVAFDIANHFNEYAGGTDDGVPDYGLFPNNEKQQEFVRSYLKASQGVEATDAEVDVLHAEVQAYILANHLYWGLWAVNQASTEGCDEFDYLLYAKHRIGRYQATKSK